MRTRARTRPGLEGVVAAESALGLVDGANGRLLYRGYPIGELVEKGSYPAIATSSGPVSGAPMHAACHGRQCPSPSSRRCGPSPERQADGRATDRGLGAGREHPARVAADGRARPRVDGVLAVRPGSLRAPQARRGARRSRSVAALVTGFLYQLNGERADDATARALDAYFVVGAEHGLNASTFAGRVITATRSDLASAVCGAIGALKGPLHGGAPSEVVERIHEVGSVSTPSSGSARRSPAAIG